jgi:hypothetical protein
MMNEKEIMLNSEEIQQLLEGGLFWKDIEPKLAEENSAAFEGRLRFSDSAAEESGNESRNEHKDDFLVEDVDSE